MLRVGSRRPTAANGHDCERLPERADNEEIIRRVAERSTRSKCEPVPLETRRSASARDRIASGESQGSPKAGSIATRSPLIGCGSRLREKSVAREVGCAGFSLRRLGFVLRGLRSDAVDVRSDPDAWKVGGFDDLKRRDSAGSQGVGFRPGPSAGGAWVSSFERSAWRSRANSISRSRSRG